jgi:tRNA threonylcarbamoyladenosine biosynthesis protein TsaB
LTRSEATPSATLCIALETAAEHGGVALLEGERVLGEQPLAAGQGQAGGVLVALDALLREHRRSLDEVSLIALSIGPGSFTGLRVGLATALGLGFGSELRIAPVSTLAALSLHAGPGLCVPLLDARKGQVYAGLYRAGGEALAEDSVCDPLPFLRTLLEAQRVTLIGPGAQLYRREIEGVLGARARIVDAERSWPCAAAVGLLGERLAAAGLLLPAGEVQLRYLRASQAEVEAAAAARQNAPEPLDTSSQNA